MSSAPIRSSSSPHKQGFLLIEALIALSMLCVVALGVGGYFHALFATQSEGMNRLKAVSIARTAMEHLCAGNERLIESGQEQFTVTYAVVPDLRTSYARATITVSWSQAKDVNRSITLDSGVSHEHA